MQQTLPVPDWSAASCRDEDPELFFPIGTGEPATRQARRAKAVCARCVLADQCLRWALAADPVEGIWGGLTEQERRQSRSRRGAARPSRLRAT